MKKKIVKRMGIACMFMICLALSGCGEEEIVSHRAEKDSVVEEDITSEEVFENSDENVTQSTEMDTDDYELKEVFEGDVAPEFSTPLVDGSTFTLSEHSGKVVLLNFWATWCGPCVGEMPAFQKLYEEYGDKVAILAVNCMEDKDSVDQFVQDSGYSFPIAYDENGDVSFTYPSSGIPYTLVIGKDGVVKNIYVGAADADTQYQIYKSAIDTALAE